MAIGKGEDGTGGRALASVARNRAAMDVNTFVIADPRFTRFAGVPAIDASTVTRDQLSVPVSPVPDPNDTTLFESPGDPTHKFYLPRYRIIDKPPLQLSLAQGATDWTLTVELEKYPASELGTASQTAGELPHTVSIVLRYNLLVGTAVAGVKELALDELTTEPTGVKAVLRGNQTAPRDQLFLAMTDPKYAPALIVRRVANIAVPVPVSAAVPVSSGQATLRGTWFFSFDRGAESDGDADVWWVQQTSVERWLQPKGNATIVNLGAVDFDSIDVNALQGYSFSTTPIPGNADASNQLTPGDVFAVHTAAGNYAKVQVVTYGYDLVLRWATYAPPALQRPRLLFQPAAIDQLQQVVSPPTPRTLDPPPPPDPTITASVTTKTMELPGQFRRVRVTDPGAVEIDPGALRVSPIMNRTDPVAKSVDPATERIDPTTRSRIFPPWHAPPSQPQPPPPPPTAYHVTVYSDEERLAPDPFVFSTASSVFVNLGQIGGSFGLERNDVAYQGRSHSYYRDLAEPWVFYYLPDAFKLGRRDASPHAPAMSVTVQATDDKLEHASVTLTYLALPYVDQARLDAATAALAPKLPVSSLPAGVTGPVLQGLQTDEQSVTYSLSLPSSADGGFQVRDKAVIDLRTGIGDTITVSLADFQSIYRALFTNTELFHGRVEVRLGAGAIHTEHIDLIGQLADMAGAAPVDVIQHADQAAGTVTVTVKNSIESPVQIDGLAASLTRDGATFAASIQGIDSSAPLQLAAGAAASFTVVAAVTPVPGSGQLSAVLDLSGLKVLPDAQAVWNSILDHFSPNQYQYPIILEIYQSAFNPPADNAQDQVQAIQVDFVQDGTVEVTPGQLPAPAAGPNPPEPVLPIPVTLHLAISDYVLNTPQFRQFQYQVTHVRTSGSVKSDWVTVTDTDRVRVQ